MNLSQTVDAAAQLMAHADHIVQNPEVVKDPPLHEFWVYSRDLNRGWMQNLSVCQKVIETGTTVRQRQCWLEYEPDVRDILRADVLYRAWYTILAAADIEQNRHHAEPIVRSSFVAHLQVRVRCLKLVLMGHKIDAARMRTLNELRKNSELWSDMLCGHLASRYQIEDSLFNRKDALRWGEKPLSILFPELKFPDSPASDLNWNLVAGLRNQEPLNPLQQLLKKMLGCFPKSAFDSNGLLRKYSSQ